MTYETIIFSITDGQARITLNRPSRLNSFSESMHAEIADAVRQVSDPANGARMLLLSGAGRAFCAGQDLSEGQMSGDAANIDLGATVERFYAPLIKSIQALPLPVLCAVNGVAAGAGANLALACDLVIAKQSAIFLQPFVRLSLLPDTAGTYLLPRLVGRARAMGLSLLGERLKADVAEEWGLIWKSVPDADFESTVDGLASQLAAGPSLAYAQIKVALNGSLNRTLEQQLDVERDGMRLLGKTRDYREGIAAFLDKREPVFSGR